MVRCLAPGSLIWGMSAYSCAIPLWCVYESTGFHLGNIGPVRSPATIKEYVARYVEASGCNYFVGSFQWGDVTHEEASRSLNLFTSEVMPDFAD